MTEAPTAAIEMAPHIDSELAILQSVETKILSLFNSDPERDLAKMALFDHLYTDQVNKITYSAPNAHALPYLLQILAGESHLNKSQLADSLSVVPIDVKNVRRINDITGTTDAGDRAIALNLASLYTTDESGQLTSVGVRHSGDELLGVTTHKDLKILSEGTKNIQANLTSRYPETKGIDCTPEYKCVAPIPVSSIDLHKSRRDIDIVARLYNPSKAGLYLNNYVLSDLMTEGSKPIKAKEIGLLPESLQDLVVSAGESNAAWRLALHATFNEMYPRSEPVYNHSQFFAVIAEKQAKNPDKKYRPIFLGPIGIKTLNKTSHSKGDDVMKSTAHLLYTDFKDVTVTQDRGSFTAWVEDSPDFDKKIAELNDSITDQKIQSPEKFLHDPAIVVTEIDMSEFPQEEKVFWNAIDLHRPNHYFHELSLFIEKLSSHTLWESIMPRLTSRIDQIRELLLSAKNFKLTIQDVNLLSQTPASLANSPELIDYLNDMRNFITRLDWDNKTVKQSQPRWTNSSTSA